MEDMVGPSASFWSGRRVLITGHTGFKGVWTSLWLQELGAEVYGLSLPPPPGLSLWEQVGRPWEAGGIGDIRSPDIVAAAFKRARPEILIHMAAQALVHTSYEDPVTTFDTNIMGLVRVLEAARTSPDLKAIVNVTSDKCYENREQLWAYRETEPMGGHDPYSASKGCAELITASYRSSFFDDEKGPVIGSGRAGNVIGGGDWAVNRLVPDSVRAFSDGVSVRVRNPMATRPWQHVLEPICGYLMLAEALYKKRRAVAEGWNFGPSDDDAWAVKRVVSELAVLWGEGAKWEADSIKRPKEAVLLRVDAAKARSRLGWYPRLPIVIGLSWTVDWYRAVLSGESPIDATLSQIGLYQNLVGAAR